MSEARDVMALLAAIGTLTLAITALASARRSPMSRPLAALCFVLFGWNFSTLGARAFGGDALPVLDSVLTALSPPLVLEVVSTFVGRTGRHRAARVAAWLWFGGLAVATVGAQVVLPRGAGTAWLYAPTWAASFLVAWAPTLALQCVLLVRHLGAATEPSEKARTRTMLAALAIGATFSTSDVVHGVGLPMPYLGSLGTLLAAALLASSALRLGLFDENVPARTAVYVAAMVGSFVVAYLVLFRVFAQRVAPLAIGSTIVTLLVVAVARELGAARTAAKQRAEQLIVLGRFSAQMSHDLKSPLTALLGAAQVLDGLADPQTDAERRTARELLALTVAQARRISVIVERYDRMGRIELRTTLVQLDEVARDVARAHGIDAITTEGDGALECDADRDLLESAIDNVVRNAAEATREGGDVRVEVTRRGARLVVRVTDTGPGMDARRRDRAFDDFFTTKETGSGLGLAFARRVMLAHGGDVTLESAVGVGTTVELTLPSQPLTGATG